MAIKLDAANTHTVIVALEILREEELTRLEPSVWKVEQIERLIKSYRKSLTALERWEAK